MKLVVLLRNSASIFKVPAMISLSLVFFIFISGSYNAESSVLLDRIVAAVNSEAITWSELMNVITHEGREYLKGSEGKEKEAKIKELERPFLDKLVERKLQLQEAGNTGLYVSDAEINGAVREIKQKFGMTDEVLRRSLEAEGLTMEAYRESLADQILLQKVVNHEVKSRIVVTDREIQEYYEAHRAEFAEQERVRIRQIFFAMPENEHQKTAVKARAGEVMKRLEKGEDFAGLAREFSEDPSRHFGGDIGYISRGSVMKEIEEKAFSMDTGEVSKPFWSPSGLHIIKVEDRTGGEGIQKARERIKETRFLKKVESEYRQWKTGLREKAYVEIKL